MVHKGAGQFDAAEQVYLRSLANHVQTGNRAGEASSLNELGNLYDAMGRYEDSARFCRQAADIYIEFEDLAKEGVARSNLADTLIKLKRYDEARNELRRAIECAKPFGHAVQPWTIWNNLCNLERASGDAGAAGESRHKAVEAYLAYRRAGGENPNPGAQFYATTARAIAEGKTGDAGAELAQILERPDVEQWARALIPTLQAILDGSRDPDLAENPDFDYGDAVEVRLLLENVAGRA